MDVLVANNGAGDLVMSFFDWGYKCPSALKAGTHRRFLRESAEASARSRLYRDTPSSFPETRQVRRKWARTHPTNPN